ncbi:unnamed protein product [Adineta ricciae]|uniref:Pericentriolar material 1 protein C-terminal domain-containing protein n=1 Tax=Adineta ricciae TaxID=249248 RepID=A0A815NMZ3_ADIRI|nr:unnamed protein product [Adineta ricciae]
MALKRKTRNLPDLNDVDKRNQMSFFDPVYQNDGESDGELSRTSSSRQTCREQNPDESTETLNANTAAQDDQDEELPDDQSAEASTARIVARVKQIQHSIEQAQTMLDSMDKFKHLVPGSDDQCDKLRVIISNLEEQQAGYMNLLNLITLTNEERSMLISKISALDRSGPTNNNDQLDEDEEEEAEREQNTKPAIQRKVQFPNNSRLESRVGFNISTTSNQLAINTSDNEQNTRNDNSNYDSLVGSLKSDTINWKDQQSTSGDEASDVESEKEIERSLMHQKEQLRALQGQKRALLALKKRSEQRLLEQQQELLNQKSTVQSEDPTEKNLLSDINNLRDRLQLLRSLYEQKHEVEVQQLTNPTKKPTKSVENRQENLHHVREQLDELEKILTYYQFDLMDPPGEEETTIFEEDPIRPDDVQRLKSLLDQQKMQTSPPNTKQPLDKLSNELAAKRLELEQAKSALTRLQQMVKTIEPDQPSTSNKPTKSNEQNTSSLPSARTSLQVNGQTTDKTNSILTTNTYADVQMAAQHREIERLVESRQRLQTLKDQIASLHQSVATSPTPSKRETIQLEKQRPKSAYGNQIVTSQRRQNTDDELEFDQLECQSGDDEETDDDSDEEVQQTPIKQGNFRTPEDIVDEHERSLLSNKRSAETEDLSAQMREICRCLSTFIQEQKSFNRHIEEHLTAATNNSSRVSVPSTTNVSGDMLFNQLQQQVLTQGLIVNLNTAYREIAILQSEINALQSENNRLSSSLSSYENEAQLNSKESIYNSARAKPMRPPVRPKLNEYVQPMKPTLLGDYNRFENSSKTSFNSQSTGKRTAINFDKNQMETTPTKHDKNGIFSTHGLASPKPTYLNSKQLSDEYEITSSQYHRSSKGVPSKSFIIRRRPITNDDDNTLTKPSSADYNQRLQQNTFDDDDDDDESDDEEEKDNLSRTIFNTQLTSCLSPSSQDFDNVDVQTLNLQVKAIMVQLIPFMRLQINETFNRSLLNNIRDRLIFLFKRQPDTVDLVTQFQDQFSESLEKMIDKYCGTMIRDCAADLIRDISDVVFDELVKYKVIKDTADATQTTNADEQMATAETKQRDDYSNIFTSSALESTRETSLVDDGENETKYQIELAESESRPLTLVGSDEEDNESDREENQDSELETAVSRQEVVPNHNENTSSSESNSNGLGYVIVNRTRSDDTVNESVPDDDEKKASSESNLDL